ncbi:hypothetical protein GCM10020367_71970 [Streptomyces sannanensis]|uniref:Uncharacterized protein n=1 Tax=Streptomyces sannanensis TaxID=285536 RepID=A0ABP6SN67_9ACTN
MARTVPLRRPGLCGRGPGHCAAAHEGPRGVSPAARCTAHAAPRRRLRAAATPLHWAHTRADGPTADVTGTLGWDLDLIGPAPVATADLVHIAASAYLADRTVRRPPTTFVRRIELTAHAVNPEPGNSPCGQLVEELLRWLTVDVWRLRTAVL